MNNEYYIDRYLNSLDRDIIEQENQYQKDYEQDLIKKNNWRFNNGGVVAG